MIYIFLANGFEEVEALATVDVLRRADLKVKIVGVGSDVITGAHGISTVCDAVDSDLTPDGDIEAVILPGGMPGTLNLERSAKVNAFVDYAYENQSLSVLYAPPRRYSATRACSKAKKLSASRALKANLKAQSFQIRLL